MIRILRQIIRTGIVTEPLQPVAEEELRAVGTKLEDAIRKRFGRSLTIRQVDAGSCNGCELEIHAMNNPIYNCERFGIHFTASPRFADMLLVTGPVVAACEGLEGQAEATRALFEEFGDLGGGLSYGEGKWTVKQVLGHLADDERVFAYRALRIARGDQTPLASFDENAYMPVAGFDQRAPAGLLAEYVAVREATLALFRGLPAGAGDRPGVASGAGVSVRALLYIIAGHERHHLRILHEPYL